MGKLGPPPSPAEQALAFFDAADEALDREVDRPREDFAENQPAWARAVHRTAFLTLAATVLILLVLGYLAI